MRATKKRLDLKQNIFIARKNRMNINYILVFPCNKNILLLIKSFLDSTYRSWLQAVIITIIVPINIKEREGTSNSGRFFSIQF